MSAILFWPQYEEISMWTNFSYTHLLVMYRHNQSEVNEIFTDLVMNNISCPEMNINPLTIGKFELNFR